MFLRKRKVIVIMVCLLLISSSFIQIRSGALWESRANASTTLPLSVSSLPESGSPDTAANLVKNMKVGWNLGNALENKTNTEYKIGIQERGAYDCAVNYTPKKYDVWNASPKVSFSEKTGKAEIIWDLSTIKSSANSEYGSFGIQIYNFAIGDTGQNKLSIEITKATITMPDGKVIKLKNMLGKQQLLMVKGIAKFYPAKSQTFNKTGDMTKGKLNISIKITKYPNPSNPMSKSKYYETLLNNPVTTNEMIKKVADAGFGAVRIPITYSNHIDPNTGLIDQDWLQRMEEIVNYVINNDMYCIINVHHDTGESGWLKASEKSYINYKMRYKRIWKQVATRFASYSNKLLFEGFNEILDEKNNWSNPGMEALVVVNKLNQDFVTTVRSTGGNNANRCLIVNTYGAIANNRVLNNFTIPKDSVKGRLIAEVHIYTQQDFTWHQNEVSWTTARSTWGTASDKEELNMIFSKLDYYLVSKGIPVIIGEFGAWNKNNLAERMEYTSYYISEARKYGITCFWWDGGGSAKTAAEVRSAALLDRKTLKWYFPDLVKTLTNN